MCIYSLSFPRAVARTLSTRFLLPAIMFPLSDFCVPTIFLASEQTYLRWCLLRVCHHFLTGDICFPFVCFLHPSPQPAFTSTDKLTKQRDASTHTDTKWRGKPNWVNVIMEESWLTNKQDLSLFVYGYPMADSEPLVSHLRLPFIFSARGCKVTYLRSSRKKKDSEYMPLCTHKRQQFIDLQSEDPVDLQTVRRVRECGQPRCSGNKEAGKSSMWVSRICLWEVDKGKHVGQWLFSINLG